MSNAPGCKVAKSGDPIEIGDMLGHGMELNLITGRVIGFTKEKHPAVIFRRYSNQTEKWPSGPVALTRLPYPHVHFADGSCARFIMTEEPQSCRPATPAHDSTLG